MAPKIETGLTKDQMRIVLYDLEKQNNLLLDNASKLDLMKDLKRAIGGNPAEFSANEAHQTQAREILALLENRRVAKARVPGVLGPDPSKYVAKLNPITTSTFVEKGVADFKKYRIFYDRNDRDIKIMPRRLGEEWQGGEVFINGEWALLRPSVQGEMIAYLPKGIHPDASGAVTIDAVIDGEMRRMIVYEDTDSLRTDRPTNEYDRFYFDSLSKIDRSSEAKWLEQYDAVTRFVGRIIAKIKANPAMIEKYAPIVHDNGIYEQIKEHRSDKAYGAYFTAHIAAKDEQLLESYNHDLDLFLKATLTEDGYEKYSKRYQNVEGWEFDTDIVQPTESENFVKVTGAHFVHLFYGKASEYVNSDWMPWADLVKDAENYSDPTARLAYIKEKQIPYIAAALVINRMSVQLKREQMVDVMHNIWTYVGQKYGREGWDKDPLVRNPLNEWRGDGVSNMSSRIFYAVSDQLKADQPPPKKPNAFVEFVKGVREGTQRAMTVLKDEPKTDLKVDKAARKKREEELKKKEQEKAKETVKANGIKMEEIEAEVEGKEARPGVGIMGIK